MLSREEVYDLMRKIADTGGLTEDMEKDLERLKAEFDERDGELRRYRERYDGEKASPDERREDERVERSEYEKLKADYDGLRTRYLDRFWGKVKDDVMEETEEDVKRDGTVQTYDELFERKEG